MAKSIPIVSTPPDSKEIPAGDLENLRTKPEGAETFLDWRARSQDDDPDSAKDWARFSEDLALLVRECGGSRGILNDPEEARQEAWVVMLMRLPGFSGRAEASLRAWLTVVVRNRLANLRRQETHRREVPLDPEFAFSLVGPDDDPAVAFARDWIVGAVQAALEEARGLLPETSYRVVRLKWIEGLTSFEIAKDLGLSVTQVRDRDRRALPVLGRLLKHRVHAELIGWFGEGFDSSEESGEVAS